MPESIASALVTAMLVYAGAGLIFALAFVTRGAGRIDPEAASGSWGFRLLILPGSAALWPLLALRWARGLGPPDERNPHRDAARADADPRGGSAP